MVRALKVGLAVLLLVSAGRAALGEHSKYAEEAAIECDRLAASPLDHERKSAGVELDQIDVSRAIPACRDAVSAGDLPAMSHLARALMKKGDHAEAFKWFEKAAENGNAVAMNNVGSLYAKGQGVPQDYAKARDWYKKAAEKGNGVAMNNLGVDFATGQGVPQDYVKARDWFEKAAAKDNALAMAALGILYREGKGVARDYAKAQDWFDKAQRLRREPLSRPEPSTR
jgi:TPR repeat protein